ncbi:uncharacterized protein LOC131658005 [Vicia villosa]|uniref:uncharacterized protein LOC131658005 n=1 Tax=Vicia villosa TaxID=3911 RepID=UPI00273C8A23|nr:uncharacterized protein LOC131658005 [Vicia villosa]
MDFYWSQKISIITPSVFWWRDLVALCDKPRGILHNITVKIGNGNVASFWNSRWIGNDCLAALYPNLYHEISSKSSTVNGLGCWRGSRWWWELRRHSEVLGQEASLQMSELQNVLAGIEIKLNSADLIVWPFAVSKCFTVKSCYNLLIQELESGVEDPGIGHGLKLIWEAHVPSKIKIFGWRLLNNGLPTRKLLIRRGIIVHNHEALCAFCGLITEDSNHLFMLCHKIRGVWLAVMKWLDLDSVEAVDCCSQIRLGVSNLKGKMKSNRAAAIWMTVWWCIWRVRNAIIFKNAEFDSVELFYSILWHSWWWLAIVAKERILCNFYEWFKNPSLCN